MKRMPVKTLSSNHRENHHRHAGMVLTVENLPCVDLPFLALGNASGPAACVAGGESILGPAK